VEGYEFIEPMVDDLADMQSDAADVVIQFASGFPNRGAEFVYLLIDDVAFDFC
jgi:hypothetical protein